MVASPASLPLVLETAAGLDVRVVLAGGERLPGADVLLTDLETGGDGPLVDRAPDDLAALLYTGGTTGRAKGVMLTHDGLSRISQARAQAFATSGAVDLLLPLPLLNVYGVHISDALAHSRFVVLRHRFDPAGWVELVERLWPQAGALVPLMLQRLLAQDLDGADPSSLVYVTTGGAPVGRCGSRSRRSSRGCCSSRARRSAPRS